MPRHSTRVALLFSATLSIALLPGGASGASSAPLATGDTRTKAEGTDQAKAELKEMSDVLAAAKTMHFNVRNLVPMKDSDGNWITLVGGGSATREGRDKLHIETGGNLFPFRLFFDGKTVTAFAPQANVYAQKDAPGTIDEALERAAKNGEAAFVFADLVSADPYASMTKGLRSARIVGTSTVDGVETRHVAVHGQQLDWEIWIGTKDHLPRMVTLTDISERPGSRPRRCCSRTGSSTSPSRPTRSSFRAPADATEVPFRNPGQLRAAARRAPGGHAPLTDGGVMRRSLRFVVVFALGALLLGPASASAWVAVRAVGARIARGVAVGVTAGAVAGAVARPYYSSYSSTTVVTPPPAAPAPTAVGTVVTTLPSGCASVSGRYQCGSVWYQPYFGGNGVYYQIVAP